MTDIYVIPALFLLKARTNYFDATLLNLSPSELKLDAGRFSRFAQNRILDFKVESNFTSLRRGSSEFIPLESYITDRIDWIAARTYAKWSMKPMFHHVGKMDVTWSFADHRDAVAFKLVWG